MYLVIELAFNVRGMFSSSDRNFTICRLVTTLVQNGDITERRYFLTAEKGLIFKKKFKS